MSIRRNEATASRRLGTADLVDGNGNPYTGLLASPTIKICKPGGNWVTANAVSLIQLTGGTAGTVAVQFAQAEVDTAGDLRFSIDVGTAKHFDDVVSVDEVENNQATILADLVTLASNMSTTLTDLASILTDETGMAAQLTDIQGRLPNTLVSGNLKVIVEAVAAAAITNAAFAAGAIDNSTIAAGAISNAKVAADTLDSAQFKNGVLTNAKFAAGAIANANIAAGAIAATQLADGLLTTAKFADGALTTAKFADGFFTATKFAAGAITSTVLAANAITSTQIANSALTAAKFAGDALTAIAGGVLGSTLDGTRTVKGALTRLNSLMIGKAQGLLSGVATYFREDGTTKAFEATQDTSAGTRVAASTATGD